MPDEQPSALPSRPTSTTKRSVDHHLAPKIAEQLKQLIYEGAFAPGERLNEAELATRMGTSRGPVREAVRVLAGWGLVTPVPNRGAFVRQMSVREMLEVYELRAAVFGYAAERAAERATEAHKRELEALLLAMNEATRLEQNSLYYEINLQFHAMVVKLSGNDRAAQLYGDFVKELHMFRRRYFNEPGNMRMSNQQHRQLYEAIAEGSPAKARAVAERHVLEGRQRLLATLKDGP
ncbi:FCD domain-containing protein [Xylophilus rhododendri]|uniref:FCD domain-containing protein n=1 Tax=Xylophilus rhododendri TaxID=2697032 RepID=A0A857JBK8_9BURK|nr:FCD domain-containing protein [Xylophilus rhododendri]QHJ01327.1 FCD domain-containing protein [Xylophilus rhododendri]